jgi:hypothetical protein
VDGDDGDDGDDDDEKRRQREMMLPVLHGRWRSAINLVAAAAVVVVVGNRRRAAEVAEDNMLFAERDRRWIEMPGLQQPG